MPHFLVGDLPLKTHKLWLWWPDLGPHLMDWL